MFPRWKALFQKLSRYSKWGVVSVFALMVVTVSIVIGFWPQGPTYEGHSASYWLDQQVGWLAPANVLEAFLVMGDQGAIYLAEQIISEPSRQPKLKLWVMDKLSAYPRFTPEWLKIRSFERRKESALILLKAMGDKGKAASPILMRALQDELRKSVQSGSSIRPTIASVRQQELHTAFTALGSDDPQAIEVILECIKQWALPPPWPESMNKFTPAVKIKQQMLLHVWQNSQNLDDMAAAVLLASVAGEDDQMFQDIAAHCQADHPPRRATVVMVAMLATYTNRTDAMLPLVAQCIGAGNPAAKLGYLGRIELPDLELWLERLARSNPQVLEWMRRGLVDPSATYKEGIARVIGNIRSKDEEVCRELEGLLGSPDFWTRLAAAEALWKIRQTEKEAIDLVIVQLGHPNVIQVNLAIKGLARMGAKAKSAIPKLQELAKHPDSDVRENAAAAIRNISAPN